MKLITKNSRETQRVASILAKEVLRIVRSESLSCALVISLEGNLGAGKTTFTQGFARGLGISEKVASPTFVVLKQYAIPSRPRKTNSKKPQTKIYLLCHIDCYRVSANDLLALGFSEMLKDPHAIILVEWGDRVRRILPKDRITIKFSHRVQDKRGLEFTCSAATRGAFI